MRIKSVWKTVGFVALAFGAGILLTNFLPCTALVIIEAVIIVASGVIYILNK